MNYDCSFTAVHYFVTGINLESSLALWVNFLGSSLPFLGSCSLWFTSLFGIALFPSRHCIAQYHFSFLSLSLARSLSRSSWLLLSLLIHALDSSLSRSFFEEISSAPLSMGPSHRKLTKINLASFRLWLPRWATPSPPSMSNTTSHDYHDRMNSWVSFDFPWCLWGSVPRHFGPWGSAITYLIRHYRLLQLLHSSFSWPLAWNIRRLFVLVKPVSLVAAVNVNHV